MTDNRSANADNGAKNTHSKSQRKRDHLALKEIGKTLCTLEAEELALIPLSDTLAHAIENYKRISSREAKRRQLQFIGKLMKNADLEAINHQLEKIKEGSLHQKNIHHNAEQWRELLLNQGKKALTDFVSQFPGGDIQHLRQLIQRTRKDKEQNNNTGAAKKLYREIARILTSKAID